VVEVEDPVPISLGGGGLLGTVEPLGVVVLLGLVVLLGVVVLPGVQGLAMVAETPLGEADAVVVVVDPVVELAELPTPLFAVADVLPVDVLPVEGVLLSVVDVPMLPLLAGVHGATVVEVPVVD
jgi:hypothetical protein